jgi:hypothetical protein
MVRTFSIYKNKNQSIMLSSHKKTRFSRLWLAFLKLDKNKCPKSISPHQTQIFIFFIFIGFSNYADLCNSVWNNIILYLYMILYYLVKIIHILIFIFIFLGVLLPKKYLKYYLLSLCIIFLHWESNYNKCIFFEIANKLKGKKNTYDIYEYYSLYLKKYGINLSYDSTKYLIFSIIFSLWLIAFIRLFFIN